MKTLTAAIVLFLSLLYPSFAHDGVPRPDLGKPVALVNATIHPVSSDPILDGVILFEDGKIVKLGKKVSLPEGAEIIDLKGKHIYPGLISSQSSLGLVEIDAVRASRDTVETGRLNPNARAESAVNPDSELIPVTRANGVLVAHVSPSTRGLIAGSTAAMYLDGWTNEDMTIAAPVGIAFRWPRAPREPAFNLNSAAAHDAKKAEDKYGKDISVLEEAFANARAFWKAKESGGTPVEVNLRWEALKPVLERRIPAIVTANSLREIRDAVAWSIREDIRITISGGRDAWRAVELLKKNDVAVLINATQALPRRRWESYDTSFLNPLKLSEAGVAYAIAFGGSSGPLSANERNLPYEAAKAVAHGLPYEEALKSITLYPAQILGIANRLGSLEVGKDATLIVTNGDPLDIRTNVESAFIQGRSLDLASRHTQLYEKYKKKYEQMK